MHSITFQGFKYTTLSCQRRSTQSFFVPAGASQEVILGFKSLYSCLVQPDRNLKVSFLKALLHPFTAASDLNTSGASRSDTRSAACSCSWSVDFGHVPSSAWH